MSRSLSSAMQSAAAARTVYPVLLWYGDFATGAVRVTTHTKAITYGGNTFTGLGGLIEMDELREAGQVEATGAIFRLNNVPGGLIVKALEAGYRRRQCSLYVGLLDVLTGTLISDPIEFRYLMDQMTISDGGEMATVEVRAEARLVDLQRPRELRHTNESQQTIFAGDRFFEFVPQLASLDLALGGGGVGPSPMGAVSGFHGGREGGTVFE